MIIVVSLARRRQALDEVLGLPEFEELRRPPARWLLRRLGRRRRVGRHRLTPDRIAP